MVSVVTDLGSSQPLDPSWDIEATWEIFSFRAQPWRATYVGWKVWVDKDTVELVKARAKQLPAKTPAKERRAQLEDVLFRGGR